VDRPLNSSRLSKICNCTLALISSHSGHCYPMWHQSMFFDAEMNCDLNSTLDLGKIAERSSNKFDLIIRSSYAKRQREIETKRFGSR
jgi:hypothetical protein